MEEKKNNNGLIVLIIILSVCVLGLGGYIVYDKLFSDDKSNNTVNNNTSSEDKKDAMDIVNNVLSRYSGSCNELIDRIFLFGDNITVNDLRIVHEDRTYNSALEYSWRNSNHVLQKKESVNIDCEDDREICNKYTYDANNILTQYHSLFGIDSNPSTGDVFYAIDKINGDTVGLSCKLQNNGTIACTEREGGDMCLPERDVIKEAYISNNILYIIDEVISHETMNDSGVVEYWEDAIYKLSFKQNSDNTWYWVSTEQIQ